MKHELSKELLERTIADWEAARNEIPFGLGEEGENTLAALKFTLAAHEQEPIGAFHISGGTVEATTDYCKDGEWPVHDGIVEVYTHPAPSIPTVSFYRDGIEAAAKWVDAQREAYDNEHGTTDPETGTFEFGNDAQLEYSATLAEIADGIRALHPNASSAPSIPAAVPEGYALVPVDASRAMIDAERRVEEDGYDAMHKAMMAAAPKGV
ncbi:hypothetical protein [Phytobacter sp. AG2a]